jgi:hypothetical protein
MKLKENKQYSKGLTIRLKLKMFETTFYVFRNSKLVEENNQK